MSAPDPHEWPHLGDWPALRAASERLLADRRNGDAAFVQAGKLATAEARDRVARALVAIFAAVEQRQDIPQALPATPEEIRADLERAVPAATKLAGARPGDRAAAVHAARLALIAHHMRPTPSADAPVPMIFFCHACNQQHRAGAIARVSAGLIR